MNWPPFTMRDMLFLLVHVLVLSFAQALIQEPRFNVVTKNVTVVAGQTAVLPCSVDYLGKYRVVWQSPRGKTMTLEDRRIISDERISLERPYVKEWNLHIRHVKISDAGTFQCQINTDPVQVRPVMLHVHQQAKIIDHLSSALSVSVREGETVELVCNVTGFPTPTVTWYRIHTGLMAEGEETGKKRIGMEGEVLVIHNVSRYCDDKYECVAFNGVPPAATREIRVHVEFPPEVRLPNQRIGQVRGRSTILECEITAYPHILSVWRRNGEDITRSAKYTTEIYNEGGNKVTLSLKVQSLTKADYGEYECYALNLLGNDAETMVLYEYHNPLKKTTTTTTTTTIQPPWSQNVDHRGGYSKYENGDGHRQNPTSGHNDNPNQSPWQQERQEGDKQSEQNGSGDNYPPYNNWRNPEYSYEPEAEGGSVISDPKDGKNRASSQTTITYTVVPLLLFVYKLTVR